MKMIFHFVRIEATDLAVEAETEGQCMDKAIADRMKQCRPLNFKGEVVE